MGRLGPILFVVLAVWLAAKLYSEGFEGAFGGWLAGNTETSAPAEQRVAPHERAARRWQNAHETGVERAERTVAAGEVIHEPSDEDVEEPEDLPDSEPAAPDEE
jgi:hypothetical protein